RLAPCAGHGRDPEAQLHPVVPGRARGRRRGAGRQSPRPFRQAAGRSAHRRRALGRLWGEGRRMSTAVATLNRLFAWKIRGVRWVEIIGVLLVAAMVFSVYLAKAAAARESARIADLERQITENGQRVRLLRAEVARLERPGRLEALSRQARLGPVDVHQRATVASLPDLAPAPEPEPVVIVAPTASAAAEPVE